MLIYENELQKAEVIFVLGGNAFDRGIEAANIYHKKYSDHLVCTSKNIPEGLITYGLPLMESEITKRCLLLHNVPESKVTVIPKATSTLEESQILLDYCKVNDIHSCILVTSKYHTWRVKTVFKDLFEEAGIEIIIRGAKSTLFDEAEWWKTETGFSTFGSEYAKFFYYLMFY